jgi:hypothetical protein
MTRLLSAVVSGTVFLNGDDLTRPGAQSRARTYLTNPRINAVARIGRAFRPVEGNTGSASGELFVLTHEGVTYLAVFNFAGRDVTKSINLGRAGLDAGRTYAVTDLWTTERWDTRGTLRLGVNRDSARLLRLD